MTLLIAWAAFPLLLLALAVGCGLLLERAAATTIPRSLIVPAGMATIIVLAEVPIAIGAVGLTAPLIVLAAAVGLLLSGVAARLSGELVADRGRACVVFAVYAAPIVLSGEATFAGYIKLDDTTWLAITDQVMEHRRDISGLGPHRPTRRRWTSTWPPATPMASSCRSASATSCSQPTWHG